MMTISSHVIHFGLTIEELTTWMSALRLAAIACARESGDAGYEARNCHYVKQHLALVQLTGYGNSEHESLLISIRLQQQKISDALEKLPEHY